MVGFLKIDGGIHHDVKPQPIVKNEATVVSAETLGDRREEDLEVSAAEAVDARHDADSEREKKQEASETVIEEAAAKKVAARFIGAQAGIAAARAALMHAAPAPRPAFMPEVAARQPEPMPSVDPMSIVKIPKFGEARFLFVDPDSQMMYFATPAERARVDSAKIGNDSQGSRDLASFSKDAVVALTPGQVRDLLAQQLGKGSSEPVKPLVADDNNNHWAKRYAVECPPFVRHLVSFRPS